MCAQFQYQYWKISRIGKSQLPAIHGIGKTYLIIVCPSSNCLSRKCRNLFCKSRAFVIRRAMEYQILVYNLKGLSRYGKLKHKLYKRRTYQVYMWYSQRFYTTQNDYHTYSQPLISLSRKKILINSLSNFLQKLKRL
jgi:hypothetical protein